jgi:hypothetical protein
MTQAESIHTLPALLQFDGDEEGATRYRLDWVRIPVGVAVNTAACAGSGRWAVLGPDGLGLSASRYPDFAALAGAISAGARVPEVVFAPCAQPARAGEITGLLKSWLADERLAAEDTRLVFVIDGGLAAQSAEPIVGLTGSPIWGQVIAAQLSYPGRFALVGIDGRESSFLLLPAAAATGEPELEIRAGVVLAPRPVPSTVGTGSGWADDADAELADLEAAEAAIA